MTAHLARLRSAIAAHPDAVFAAAALVIVGWSLPAGDRFGFILALAVGYPWLLAITLRAELRARDVTPPAAGTEP